MQTLSFSQRQLAMLKERVGTLLALAGLCLLFSALTGRFFEVDNFLNVARQISINGIIAVGMTLIIVTGGIDLSVGSVVALSSCAAGLLMSKGLPATAALPVGLVVGLICGLGNGLLITQLGLSPFIASLGMMSVARGGAMVLTGGNPVIALDKSYFALGSGSFLKVPWPVWLMLAVAAFGALLLNRTRAGRYALAMGSNEEAVRLSGVSVNGYKLFLYVLMGGLAAVAGWVLSARVASADPSSGVLFELEAIAAVVIGGASLKGGKGSVVGTLLGAAIMGVLNNGLVLLGIGAFWQQLLVGVVIIAAVSVDQLQAKTAAANPKLARRLKFAGYAVASACVVAAIAAMAMRDNAPPARRTFAVMGKASGGEYWLAVKKGAEAAGQKLGVDVVWLGPPTETEVSKQVELLENMIQRRVDGIAIAPCDGHALSPVIKKALEAGIPVVTVDADSEAKDRYSYIGTDNRAGGVQAGKEMARLLGNSGTVAIVTGVLGAQNLRQRCEGFKAGLEGSGVSVLPEQSDNGDRARALAIAENLLTANPELKGFFADTGVGGPAVAQALIARQLQGKVKLISFDTSPQLMELLEQGAVSALVAQAPEKMGSLAVEALLKKANGQALEPVIDTGVDIVRSQKETLVQ